MKRYIQEHPIQALLGVAALMLVVLIVMFPEMA